jgi:nucleotide-binding universal stress UspA family protein
MVTYKNILYCTDFSESAKAALPFAIDITKKYGGLLHVVHVYRDPEHVAEYEISSQMKMDWVRLAQSLGTETEKKLNTDPFGPGTNSFHLPTKSSPIFLPYS